MTDEIRSFEINERFIFLGCRKNKIKLYDRNTLNLYKELPCEPGAVMSLKLTKKFLISGSCDSTLRFNKYL